jgi:hypothetical protein
VRAAELGLKVATGLERLPVQGEDSGGQAPVVHASIVVPVRLKLALGLDGPEDRLGSASVPTRQQREPGA